MTASITVAVAAFTLFVALIALWLHAPGAVALDGERWFKQMLATVLRGAIESEAGDVAAWEAAVARFVPYHPACRDTDRLLASPEAGVPPGTTRPDERVLVNALAALPAGRPRWDRLFGAPEGRDAVLDDPHELGAAFDPAARLGPGGDWDALAAWGAGRSTFPDAAFRRVPAKWVLIEADGSGPDLLGALADALGDRAIRVPLDATDVDGAIDALAKAIGAIAPTAGDRWIGVASGSAAAVLLRALHGAPALRDRMVAYVSIGGAVRGWPGREGPLGEVQMREWLGTAFSHAAMDTERSRTTPYLSVAWCDPDATEPGARGLRVVAQRLPEPVAGPSVSTLATIDLGVLPDVPDLPLPMVARAVIAAVVAIALSYGG